MAKKTITLAQYDPEAKASFASRYAATERAVKSAGVQVWFDSSAAQKVSNYVRAEELAARFVGTFDGDRFRVQVAYDSNVVTIAELELGEISDQKKRRATMKGIVKLKLADRAMWTQFERDNPDPKVIRDLEFLVTDAERHIWSYGEQIKVLKDFSYAKHRHQGHGDLMLALKDAAKKKGLGNEFAYAEHESYKKPAFLYETYLKEKAPKALKLPSSLLAPVAKAVATKKKPDLRKITKYVHERIDKNVVKAWAPKQIRIAKQELLDYRKKAAAAKKKLAYYGVKAR